MAGHQLLRDRLCRAGCDFVQDRLVLGEASLQLGDVADARGRFIGRDYGNGAQLGGDRSTNRRHLVREAFEDVGAQDR